MRGITGLCKEQHQNIQYKCRYRERSCNLVEDLVSDCLANPKMVLKPPEVVSQQAAGAMGQPTTYRIPRRRRILTTELTSLVKILGATLRPKGMALNL